MIEHYLALLLIPAAVIWGWNKLVSRLTILSWDGYRITGMLGSPVHELSHVVACLLFGLRIRKMSLYSPNAITGQLGYVTFTYRPTSMRNAIGMAVQGIAPLISGGLIALILLDLASEIGHPGQGPMAFAVWIGECAVLTLKAVVAQGSSSVVGLGKALVVLIISLHAIPSLADVRVGLKGFLLLAVFVAALLLASEFLPTDHSLLERVAILVGMAREWMQITLRYVLFGAVAVVTLAFLATVVFILLPAACSYSIAFIRGATGRL